jgi:asparagine synthase (glutamine-hydrolysing)
VAAGLVPDGVILRPKQPYRAPDALSFVGPGSPAWIADVLSERSVAEAGVFEPKSVERLWKKCQALGGGEQFSNADNMALVGVLSTGLLHDRLVRGRPSTYPAVDFKTMVDRVPHPGTGVDLAPWARGRGVI